jgi:hypothetical protein
MASTERLIGSLVAAGQPVRRLRPPLLRALLWLLGAIGLIALLAAIRGLRPDLATQLATPTFVPMLLASLATGALAAVAAFHLSLPDRSRWWGGPAAARGAALAGLDRLWLRRELGRPRPR